MLQVLKAQTAAASVINTANIEEDVSNSAEVEQSQEQSNNCEDFAACANVAGAQVQPAAASVINTANIFDEVSNSAEVEQSARTIKQL